jgi:hypothetical protein
MSVGAGLAPPSDDAVIAIAPPVEWSFNPWRERPARSVAATVLALGLCLLVLAWRESVVLSGALCLAAVATLSPALSPLECRVDEEGVARRGPFGWERRRWSDIRRAVLRRAGLLVSPYRSRHWLDATRGLYLPLPSSATETLTPSIEPYLHRHGF